MRPKEVAGRMWVMGRAERIRVAGRAMVVVEMAAAREMVEVMVMGVMEIVAV